MRDVVCRRHFTPTVFIFLTGRAALSKKPWPLELCPARVADKLPKAVTMDFSLVVLSIQKQNRRMQEHAPGRAQVSKGPSA